LITIREIAIAIAINGDEKKFSNDLNQIIKRLLEKENVIGNGGKVKKMLSETKKINKA
jgi:hypothetical protein